jgi:hypothetical protein
MRSSISRILPGPAALRQTLLRPSPIASSLLLARFYSTEPSAATPSPSTASSSSSSSSSPEPTRFHQTIPYKEIHHQPTRTVEELLADPSIHYLVRRTPSAQLPIYNRWKAKAPVSTVLIKKIEGDKVQLVDDIVEALGMDRANARVNPYTGHVELRVSQ